MTKTPLVVVTVLATVAATFASNASAQTIELAEPGNDKTVVESETGSYIVVMEQDPVVVTLGQDDLGSRAAQDLGEDLEAEQDEVLADIGADASDKVNTYTDALNGFSALMSYEEAQTLAGNPKVAVVLPDELHQATTDSSGDYLGLTRRGGAYDAGITGEDVIVGVIDSGIWPEHPSFADDGTYSDLGVALDATRPNCEFGNTAQNADDVPFTCNNKLLGARQMLDTYRAVVGPDAGGYDSARDEDGHGTHTASTAAGNAEVEASMYGEDLGEVSGIAPRARVIAYKGLGVLGGFTSDLAASIDQAVADGVDVINYSIGGGASTPTGADELAFLFAADAGVFVATSAGNSGPGEDTVGSPGNAPWLTTVGASTQKRFYEGDVRVFTEENSGSSRRGGWWNWHRRNKGWTVSGASLTPELDRTTLVDAEDVGNELCLPDTFTPGSLDGLLVLCRRGAIGRAAKGEAVAAAGGAGMVLYNFDDDDNLFTDTHVIPAVHINFTDGVKLKKYIDDQAAKGKDAEAQISDTGDTTSADGAPSMTYFSSRGVNGPIPDIIKPDLTAPGHQILAGTSPGTNPFGDSFMAISGTSMSSPHVAGLFALIKQAHPDWSAAMAKSALMTTANTQVRAEDRSTQATPFEMGAGEINPGRVTRDGSAFSPGLVYDAGLFEYAAFTCGADYGVFAPGSCSFLEGLGLPTDASDLNIASIGVAEVAGSQTVTRTVTSVADQSRRYRARIDEPDGFSVTVSPSSFTIEPGATQTIEITITNEGAPVGEWRFGELELRSGRFNVASPIAVNAAAFDAPAEVGGTGADGTASFDVSMGYSGAYSAAPHGLVPSDQLTGSIAQDPDQTFSGIAEPGVDLFDLSVTGTALLRISLSMPVEDDIDLYLLDSRGTIVATSTNGGTDELIELVLPADDNYKLAVHGWSVVGDFLDYAVDSWAVPLAPGGGSLSITSAPSSATLGTVETIEVAWTGLDLDTSYLGAVSHTDAAGLLGLTVVSVTS